MSRAATSRLKVNPPLGTPPTLEWRAVGDLLVDPTYQRSIDSGPSKALIRKIATYWDWGLCQPLAVSRRPDGKLTIVDGQHRASAAKARGDIAHLPCVITAYATSADEAASFVQLNQQRRPLGAMDIFRAAVAAQDTEAVAIVEGLAKAGLRLAPHANYISWKPDMVSNIGGIQSAWREYGPDAVTAALTIIARAWPNEVKRFAGTAFPGIAKMCASIFPAGSRIDDMIAMVRQRSQIEWRSAIFGARASDPNAKWRKCSEVVFAAAWLKVLDGNCDIPVRPEEPTAPEGTIWCDFCEWNVTPDEAAGCKSAKCALKVAA